jgi:peptidoglycan/LPS O-acetylase OafA/YrhL
MNPHDQSPRSRIESLDYLRGTMALSVMMYHYVVWSGIDMKPDSLLSKLGIYAVSVFYVLSGLSLALAYKGRVASWRDVLRFFTKRIFRIAPLLWIMVTLAIIDQICKKHHLRQRTCSRCVDGFPQLFAFVRLRLILARI